MAVELIDIGFSNKAALNKVISIIDYDSAPVKRKVQKARDIGKLIDATYGRKTRSVIITYSKHIILSSVNPETMAERHNNLNSRWEFNGFNSYKTSV